MMSSGQEDIDQVVRRTEEYMSSPDCILGQLDTVKRVIEEIQIGECLPITRPELVIQRDDLGLISEAVVSGIVQRCHVLGRAKAVYPSDRPKEYVPTRNLLHNFYGDLSDVNVARVEVPEGYIERTMRNARTADPASFARYELSVEAQPSGKDRMYSAIGFTAFVKNYSTKGEYSSSRAIVNLNGVNRGAEVRDRVNSSALRAAILESQHLANPYSAGLPELRR